MAFLAVAAVIAAYLIGSINFAVIFTKHFTKNDIRDFGSGNAGTTNVMRVGGLKPGILTFVCDALKGFAASLLGKYLFSIIISSNPSLSWAYPIYGAYLCGFVCMLGHVFPIFYQFRGGKGVAVSVGIYAVCCPKAIVLGLIVFALVTLLTKTVSIGSLIAPVTVISLSVVFYNSPIGIFKTELDSAASLLWQSVLSIGMGVTIILKHIPNIKRLFSGEEKKIKIRRNK